LVIFAQAVCIHAASLPDLHQRSSYLDLLRAGVLPPFIGQSEMLGPRLEGL